MTNKKRLVAMLMVVVLAITSVVGTTLAYFKDSDADVNVMALGNVLIVQNETDREGNAYEDGQKLLPSVPNVDAWWEKDGTVKDTDGEDVAIWDENLDNEIDKFVSVTNGGTEDAYVRTILLFETVRSFEENSSTNWVDLHDHFCLVNGDFDYLKGDGTNETTKYDWMYVTIKGTEYVVAVKTYEDALKAGETTKASLRQFGLTWEAGNEVYDFFGENYDILALSQAVQYQGFETEGAEKALNAAFGEITPEKVVEWFNTTPIKTSGVNNVVPTL